MADHGAEIIGEVAGLLTALGTLASDALRDTDPARLHRVRKVIDGELAVERVLREGEESVALLARRVAKPPMTADTQPSPGSCSACGEQLVRAIVEHEDYSVSIAWLCACRPSTNDLRILTEDVGRSADARG